MIRAKFNSIAMVGFVAFFGCAIIGCNVVDPGVQQIRTDTGATDAGAETGADTGSDTLIDENDDCGGGEIMCGVQCVDLETSNDHCGDCNNSCGAEADCSAGECVCSESGLEFCSGSCVDTRSNGDHCGACGNSCGEQAVCRDSECEQIPECDPAATPFGGGDGTEQSPYVICSAEQLKSIKEVAEWDAQYVLAADLDLVETEMSVLADTEVDFTGTFAGYGNVIENLSLECSSTPCGLFGELGEGAVVSDVVIEGSGVVGPGDVGTIAGRSAGTIRNVEVYGEVEAEGESTGVSSVGGLVGYNSGSVEQCAVDGVVHGEGLVGGLVGSQEGSVTACESSVTVSSSAPGAGGLVGTNAVSAVVKDSHVVSPASVEGTDYVGGLAGTNLGRIDGCTSVADVVAETAVGGLVGLVFSNGENNSGDITNSHSGGTVEGDETVGGLVGGMLFFGGDVLINNCSSEATVRGIVGGIGGLVGDHSGTINRCYASGDVNPETALGEGVGGLVGRLRVTGQIFDSYATGDVAAVGPVGGLVGGVDAPDGSGNQGEVSTSHSIGTVVGEEDVGGLIGTNGGASASNIDNSYWNIDTSEVAMSTGGEGLSNDGFTDPENFAGFDFQVIWMMGAEYPRLKWQE